MSQEPNKIFFQIEIEDNDADVIRTFAANMDMPVGEFLEKHVMAPVSHVLRRMIDGFDQTTKRAVTARQEFSKLKAQAEAAVAVQQATALPEPATVE